MSSRDKVRSSYVYSGFTIIEVVLVLGIAGLIFLMVFVALPSLQRAQRDRLRKQDVGVVVGAVQNYMKNNSGNPPPETTWTPSVDEHTATYAHSEKLGRYLIGLSEDWVTSGVSVTDNRDDMHTFWVLSESNRKGLVEVIIGSRCLEDEESRGLYYGNETYSIEYTGKRGDIAVFRYLESGHIFCENVMK